MESHETGGHGADPHPGLPRSCPLDDAAARPLSWALGERLLDADAAPDLTLRGPGDRVTVAVYPATDHTALVTVRSPVGRRRFYEVPAGVVDDTLERASRADGWDLVRDRP